LVLLIAALGFVALLFAVAAVAEHRGVSAGGGRWRHFAYTASLGVYCTSWTFYGAVGTASTEGWSYLPIYVGPILLLLLAPRFLERLVAAARAEGAATVSDFIGSRFGKSRGVAALVTITAAFGTVPYIALQLRSVGTVFHAATGYASQTSAMLVTAALLGGFALLLGTRRYEVASRSEGLVHAVALESVVKMVALLTIALTALGLLVTAPSGTATAGLARMAANFAPQRLGIQLPVLLLLSASAFLCLPRQFHMAVIEARQPTDLRRARWWLSGYLLATMLVVLPIAWAGLALLPASSKPDLFVLTLPQWSHSPVLVVVAFLGGFSAATAMVLVETIALATMVSNDLIAPLLLRSPRFFERSDLGRVLISIRRFAILLVVAAALLWGLAAHPEARLSAIGHIAFVAIVQIAPFLVLAVQGSNRDPLPAKLGLSTGLLLWLYTLALPPILPDHLLSALSGTLLAPQALLGAGLSTPLVHGAVWSLGGNLLVFLLASLIRMRRPAALLHRRSGQIFDLASLTDFVGRFVGEERVREAFGGRPSVGPIEPAEVRTAERLLASVIGAPSAHALIASALAGTRFGHNEVARLLGQTGQSLQFSRDMLAATLENIDPGVSVIDGDLRLAAWNSRYLEMFGYPSGLVRVGTPVDVLIRYNAERGDCGSGDVEAHVARRMAHLRRGLRHSFERVRPDGRVIKTVGGPMPGGGYVMCFTDVTAEARALAGLEKAREELEGRVVARTAELTAANEKLAAATSEKTRFLAAASHDLLQPLHAARLFSAALERDLPPGAKVLAGQVDRSIAAAEQLLRALLDISKMDSGGIEPQCSPVELRPVLTELVERFRPLADEKGLALRLGRCAGVIETDATLLRSIVQNFLSNAIRYTARGRIDIRVRRHGGWLGIEVADTGAGVPADKQGLIFREFERLGTHDESGLGLGLAIVERTARLLGAEVTLDSTVGRGSIFAVWLPESLALPECEESVPPPSAGIGRHILVVDDEPAALEACRAFLKAAGHHVRVAATPAQAVRKAAGMELALVDFELGDGPDGIKLIASLRRRNPGMLAALVTANRSVEMRQRAEAAGIEILAKPVSPATLEAWIAGSFVLAAE